MKLAIVGLPQSGKATVFAALTGARGHGGHAGSHADPRIATITVPDERIDFLSRLYQPKKTTHARIEYLLPAGVPGAAPPAAEGGMWNQARTCDALLLVVRNFRTPGGDAPNPEGEFRRMEEEMVLNDLMVVEKRMERIEADRKRGRKPEGNEADLLAACREILDDGGPLRTEPELASAPALKGFTFLSAKPLLVIVNNEDEDEAPPRWEREPAHAGLMVVRARLEMDIASMPAEDAAEFLDAYHIRESALDRVIRHSYRLLNRISFFTVGSDEVRAWPITAGTPAAEAAGTVHSDMEKGFIRAETLSFEDLKTHGSFQAARKAGAVRLEGRDYEVKDGDIINFRFNV